MLAEAGLPPFSIMYRAGHSTLTAAANYQHRASNYGAEEARRFAEQKHLDRKRSAIHDRGNDSG